METSTELFFLFRTFAPVPNACVHNLKKNRELINRINRKEKGDNLTIIPLMKIYEINSCKILKLSFAPQCRFSCNWSQGFRNHTQLLEVDACLMIHTSLPTAPSVSQNIT